MLVSQLSRLERTRCAYDTRSKNTEGNTRRLKISRLLRCTYVDISVFESGGSACYRGRRTPPPQISNNGKGVHRRWHKCRAICILIGAEHAKTRWHESFLLLPHCPSVGIRAFCVGLYLSPGKLTHTPGSPCLQQLCYASRILRALVSVRVCSVCAKSASNLSTLCHRR